MYHYNTRIAVFWLVLVFGLLFQPVMEAQWKLPDGYTRPKSGMGLEGASIAKVLSTDKGVNGVQFTNPYTSGTMTTFSGVFDGSVDNNAAKFYCVDLQHYLAFWTTSNPHTYTDTNFTPSEITYILNNYYPAKPYPYSGAASTLENEAASVQLAIWHFSDGVDISTVTNSTLKTRALQIVADAVANHNNFVPLASLVVLPGVQNKQIGSPAQFTVGAYDALGNGIPNITVTLSATTGSLSATSVVTNASGVTPSVSLTQGSSNLSSITAVATIVIPQGTRYVHSQQPNNYQKLVLATPTIANNSGSGTVNWINQPGPCELNNYVTFTQGGWGSPSNSTPGHYRDTYFASVFPSGAVIGSGYTATFTSATAVKNFVPAGGTAGAFTQNYTNPLTTSAGVLAGQALALTFNVAFDQANVFGNHYTKLGDLVIASGTFAGKTVNQLLGYVNTALGGGATPYTITELNDAATKINENFDNGSQNKNYLTCPPTIVNGSIGDKVWNDTDHDGIQDAGENGVSNVTVKLYTCADVLMATTATDANGNYLFSNITPGSYYVAFTLPSGYTFSPKNVGTDSTKDSDASISTGKTTCFVLSSGENNLSKDAGMYLCASKIGDFVWHDTDADGIQDAGEPGLLGVIVELLQGTTVIATTTTDAVGKYEFGNLANGAYSVRVAASNYSSGGVLFSTTKTKWYATKKNQGTDDTKDSDAGMNESVPVTVNCGDNPTIDFGFYKTCVTVTKTANVATAVPGDVVTYTFTVENCGNITLSGGVDLYDALINPSGNHHIGNLTPVPPGTTKQLTKTYTVKATDCGPLVNIVTAIGHPIDGSANVEHKDTLTITVNCKASVGDKIWNDVNHDGIQDAGEPGISNVTVKLYTCADVLVATTATDANGVYSFNNINPGSYYVKFVSPSGYVITIKDAGSDDTKDSDADPVTGKTDCFTLTGGQNDITRDAGMYVPPVQLGSLGDKVWNDADHDGIQDAGEIGISNVTVKLYDCSDNLIATTATDASGNYLFSNLPAGSYYVKFFLPSGFVFSPKDAGSDDAKDSDADPVTGKTGCYTLASGENNLTVDAGMYVNFITIGDKVWNDLDKDGIQDAGEPGIPNVTVKLYDCNDNLIATTVTDANGIYQFCCSIAAGSYYVQFVLPSGYAFSPADQGADDALDSDANTTTGKTGCVTLIGGQSNLTLDAGLYQLPVTIGDKVWNDLDKDGVQDAGEAGIPNVTVKLYDCTGVLIAATVTDANGNYQFANVPAGSYYVQFFAPSGYAFSPQYQGANTALDSDADAVTGKTSCKTYPPGTTDNTIDAGMYFGATDLEIEKTVNDSSIVCGQYLTYTIKITNNGPISAGGIVVTDILPAGLDFVSVSASQGTYYTGTGQWIVGTLNNGSFATLTLYVQVNCSTMNIANIDLGPAKTFNVFALVDFKPSSADVQGKLAVGRDAVLGGYSVGDQLPPSGGTVDVLVVGNNLTYTSGGIWGGNVVYGNSSNLPTSAVTIFDGTVRKDTVIDFVAAKAYLENLSTQLGGYAINGTTSFQWGTLNLTHTDPFLNTFAVNGSDLSAAHTVQINVPNGSAVVVNITGTTINWHGGLFVNGTAINNVIYNFPQATNLTISGIEIRGSILAPFADLNFPAGLISGQAIFKSMVGSGQFNLAPFHGNIPANRSIVNVASITAMNTGDTNPSNNSSSASASFPPDTTGGGGSGSGSGSGSWQLIGNLPAGETVTCLESDNQGGIYAGTVNGYIYKTTDNGSTWNRVNPFMYSGPVWAIEVHPNGSIIAGTVTGVYRAPVNTTAWEQTALANKDVRTLKIDAQGNVYAGTWGFGTFVSTNCGLSWNASNNGLGNHLIVTAVTVTPNQTVFAGTFDGGVFKSVDNGANWTPVNVGYNYIWTLASNSNGDLFAGTYGDGLYRSVNNGASWVKTLFPAAHVYELRIDAADNIFAASYSGGVFVSTNNGATWTNIGMGGMALSSIMIVPNGRAVISGTSGGQIYMKATHLTDVKKDNGEKPAAFALEQNYPNPFNPSTVVRYALPFDAKVNVTVFNVTGQEISVLASGAANAGTYEASFNAANLPSGMYFCRMTAVSVDGKDKFSATRKMMLVK